MNLISLQTTIPAHSTVTKTGTIPLAPDPHDTHLRETMPAYIISGKYLLTILMEEISANTTPEVFDKYDSTESIINAFCRQFTSYTYQEPPFLYANNVEPLTYWKGLVAIEEASVLAVCGSSHHIAYVYPQFSGPGSQIVLGCPKFNGRRMHCLDFHQAHFSRSCSSKSRHNCKYHQSQTILASKED